MTETPTTKKYIIVKHRDCYHLVWNEDGEGYYNTFCGNAVQDGREDFDVVSEAPQALRPCIQCTHSLSRYFRAAITGEVDMTRNSHTLLGRISEEYPNWLQQTDA